MERGAASWMGEDPLPRVALWVIARLVCVVCWLRGCGRIPCCRENPGAGNISLVGSFVLLLAQCRRHLSASGLAASCRDTVVAPRGVRARVAVARAMYLKKHEGGQQRHNCACCSKSALETERVRPAPVVMHSHSHVLNGACCCFSEAGSVR
ncbi:trans-sialidase [Trypanosoma cruzi]|nr:trans-sialidase [Trypanosoma cruzi]